MSDGLKKYRVDWRDDQGRRRRTRFKTRREADGFMSTTAVAVNSGEWVDPVLARSNTVGDMYESWIRRIETQGARGKGPAAAKTLASYRSTYKVHIKPDWEHVSLEQVNYDRVSNWSKSLKTGNRTRSEASSIFIRIMEEAVRQGVIVRNPAKDRAGNVDYLPRVEKQKKHHYLTAVQLRLLRDAMPTPTLKALILICGLSGLRWGEATALRWGDIDFNKRLIHVERAWSDVNGRLILGTPKSGLDRHVPLHSPTRDALKVLKGSVDEPLDNLVLLSKHGTVLRNGNVTSRVLVPALKEMGDAIPGDFRFHGLRHTAVSLAISSGANIKVVQAIAGHASATLTLDTYGGLFTEDLLTAGEWVDAHVASAFE